MEAEYKALTEMTKRYEKDGFYIGAREMTALDYFMQQLGITEKSKFEITDADGNQKIVDVSEVYKIAKAMEKYQITNAYYDGSQDAPIKTWQDEQYYNETFKSE